MRPARRARGRSRAADTSGRAASWISTRSGASSARLSRPSRTVSCRVSPPITAAAARARRPPRRRAPRRPAPMTTRTASIPGWPANASIARRSTGIPPRQAYCLGRAAPNRSPRPAATIKATVCIPATLHCGYRPPGIAAMSTSPTPVRPCLTLVWHLSSAANLGTAAEVPIRISTGLTDASSTRSTPTRRASDDGPSTRTSCCRASPAPSSPSTSACASASPTPPPSSCSGRQLERAGRPHAVGVRGAARDDTWLWCGRYRQAGSTISDYGIELALARGELVGVDCHVCPVPELPENVLVVLHPCSVARRLDQQISHRRSTRSVAGLAATLAHEVKNPLSGIRGAAQLLEPAVRRGRPAADPADLRRDRPDLRPGRADGGVRRHRAGRARLGQHPPGARACPPDRRGRLRPPPSHRRALRPLAARGRGRPRPAGAGVPEPGQERGRGRTRRTAARSRWRPSTSTGCAWRWTTAATRLELPITVEVRDNGPGVPLGHGRPPVRAVRQHQAQRQRPRPVAGGQDRGRPSRRRLLPAGRARRHLPGPAARRTASSRSRCSSGKSHERREGPAGRGRCRDPHRGQPGAVAPGLRGAGDQRRRRLVALDRRRRRRRRDHRRRAARREQPRPAAAHPHAAARPAGDRDERAEHAAHGGAGGRARCLRVPAQAVRHRQPGGRRAALAVQPPQRGAGAGRARPARGAAADHRPLAGDAGDLPGHRPADEHRPHRADRRRVRHRQGAGGAGAARFRQAQGRPVRRRSTWRRSRAS